MLDVYFGFACHLSCFIQNRITIFIQYRRFFSTKIILKIKTYPTIRKRILL